MSTTLIAFATGGRPHTSRLMQSVLEMCAGYADVYAVRWRDDTDCVFRTLDMPGAYPAQAYNAVLASYMKERTALPDYYFTMDDDTLVGEHTFDRLRALLDADTEFGLLGAWNELSEHGRGRNFAVVHELGEDLVQFDWPGSKPFCVGGALHAIPKRSMAAVLSQAEDGLYPEVPRREDEGLTARVRSLGYNAALAVTVPVTLLPDDGIDPNYRATIIARHHGIPV